MMLHADGCCDFLPVLMKFRVHFAMSWVHKPTKMEGHEVGDCALLFLVHVL